MQGLVTRIGPNLTIFANHLALLCTIWYQHSYARPATNGPRNHS